MKEKDGGKWLDSAARPRPYRLAVITPHVIQYQAPLYRALAARPEISLHVYFCSRWGIEQYRDPGFGKNFSWDRPLLEGYPHSFLRNVGWRSGPSTFFSLVNPAALGIVLSRRHDAVLVNGWSLATNWIAWAGSWLSGKPLLMRGESNGLQEPAGLKGSVKRAAVKTFLARSKGLLAIGARNAEFYRSCGVSSKRIFLTPYAVDNSFFLGQALHHTGQKVALRKSVGIPSDLPVILFSGKFQEKKRPLDLLRAFRIVREQTPAALVFVGDGALRAELERFIEENQLKNVYLMGFRNQTEIAQFYALSDIFVLPSDFEPWGLVVNEAMCFGLPIVASDQVGAAADLVQEGVNGYIFPVGDVDALAQRLVRLIQDTTLRQHMGEASERAISEWGLEHTVQGILAALQHVAGRQKVQVNETVGSSSH